VRLGCHLPGSYLGLDFGGGFGIRMLFFGDGGSREESPGIQALATGTGQQRDQASRPDVGFMSEKLESARRVSGLVRDYAELTKARITALIVLTAWCGYFFGAHKSGVSSWSAGLLHALLGVALVSSGTAALNEVLEREVDARMRRTAGRPLPAGRMSRRQAATAGLLLTLGGSIYLAFSANPLTGLLVFLTALVYLAAYTPLKRVSPICTFVGAFPGAMPVALGWTAARGRLETETLILFAIMFVWQFPHFLSIAWLYREDYARGEIRMLPVVAADGKSTLWRILAYSAALIPVSILPVWAGMAGRVYLAGAVLLGAVLFRFSYGMALPALPATAPASKAQARRLLQATIVYLPVLFALMMANARW
jgi:protoheme IX farnesyltransferase